jgi:hypothetical protein
MSSPPSTIDLYWDPAYRVLYDTWMQELISEELMNFWGRFNTFSSILVAITATGSAIAGWTLFNSTVGKVIWGILSGIAALFSIVDSTLGVPGRVKEQSDQRSMFLALRVRIEYFCSSLARIDATRAETELGSLSIEHQDARKKAKGDVIWTRKWQKKTQLQLNEIMVQKGYASRESAESIAKTGTR